MDRAHKKELNLLEGEGPIQFKSNLVKGWPWLKSKRRLIIFALEITTFVSTFSYHSFLFCFVFVFVFVFFFLKKGPNQIPPDTDSFVCDN